MSIGPTHAQVLDAVQRALAADAAEIAALKAKNQKLAELIKELIVYDNYNTEYDGQVLTLCPDCGKKDGEHSKSCLFTKAKQAIET